MIGQTRNHLGKTIEDIRDEIDVLKDEGEECGGHLGNSDKKYDILRPLTTWIVKTKYTSIA